MKNYKSEMASNEQEKIFPLPGKPFGSQTK